MLLVQTSNIITTGFSALQRAENSSILRLTHTSVVFAPVSVLFSEPKIPQWRSHIATTSYRPGFQCSSASRKFLNREGDVEATLGIEVSVLFSEPKIPQCTNRTVR